MLDARRSLSNCSCVIWWRLRLVNTDYLDSLLRAISLFLLEWRGHSIFLNTHIWAGNVCIVRPACWFHTALTAPPHMGAMFLCLRCKLLVWTGQWLLDSNRKSIFFNRFFIKAFMSLGENHVRVGFRIIYSVFCFFVSLFVFSQHEFFNTASLCQWELVEVVNIIILCCWSLKAPCTCQTFNHWSAS